MLCQLAVLLAAALMQEYASTDAFQSLETPRFLHHSLTPLCCVLHLRLLIITLQALKTGKSDRAATRIGKMPAMADFQFFNTRRLTELYEREHAAEQHKQLMAQKEATLRGQVTGVLGKRTRLGSHEGPEGLEEQFNGRGSLLSYPQETVADSITPAVLASLGLVVRFFASNGATWNNRFM
jgi:hypothetical protein